MEMIDTTSLRPIRRLEGLFWNHRWHLAESVSDDRLPAYFCFLMALVKSPRGGPSRRDVDPLEDSNYLFLGETE